jgi:exosome complex component RRP4
MTPSRTRCKGAEARQEIPPESRSAISTIAALIRLFASHHIPLSDSLLLEGYGWLSKTRGAGAASTIISREDGERLIADILGVDVTGNL